MRRKYSRMVIVSVAYLKRRGDQYYLFILWKMVKVFGATAFEGRLALGI
jgi:hypothetical protein